MKTQPYKYYAILDFEASCEERKSEETPFMNEIIEFPTLFLNSNTLKVEKTFHEYVQPTKNKKLTKFCTDLTGIKQEVVDNGISFQECLVKFNKFLLSENFIDDEQTPLDFIFVTCGGILYFF
jgi:inhibitor of KinA sporulation pathway (predicted exonuclease)